jgi:hypothetical protein
MPNCPFLTGKSDDQPLSSVKFLGQGLVMVLWQQQWRWPGKALAMTLRSGLTHNDITMICNSHLIMVNNYGEYMLILTIVH